MKSIVTITDKNYDYIKLLNESFGLSVESILDMIHLDNKLTVFNYVNQ